ncbi:MAG: hypothetical protein EBS41_00995 [Actinobacteria bacterium]|jgi:hypothetical protein|nr:hypothetical protein [Actinomycetota bacterium]
MRHTATVNERQHYLHESPEAEAARAARQSSPIGALFNATPRRRVVGKALSLNTVIGLTVVAVLLVGIGAISGKFRLTSRPSTPSAPAAVRDYLNGRTLGITSGDIKIGGVSLLFIGAANQAETARLAVELPKGTTFVNGSFADRGRSWCVHVRQGTRDVVTTNFYEKVSTATTKWSCAPEGLLGITAAN